MYNFRSIAKMPGCDPDLLYLPFTNIDPREKRTDLFYRFDKRIVLNGVWAGLSPATKSALPVIWTFCDAKGKAFPGREIIGKLAKRGKDAVSRATAEIEEKKIASVTTRKTGTVKRNNVYQFKEVPMNQSVRWFPYFVRIGIWAELEEAAQKLLPVFLCGLSMNDEDYASVEMELNRRGRHDLTEDAVDVEETYYGGGNGYQYRRWEFVDVEDDYAMELAGISSINTYKRGKASLVDAGILDTVYIDQEERLRLHVEQPLIHCVTRSFAPDITSTALSMTPSMTISTCVSTARQ